jgi:hypothetical protein
METTMIRRRSRLQFVALALAALIAALAPAAAQEAQQWITHRLAEARLDLPAGWAAQRRDANREITATSADGRFKVVAFWWVPDEPILGYSDIVSSRKVTVAGRPATLIHSRFPEHQTLQVVFDAPRADGRKLIVLMETGHADFDAAQALTFDILRRIRFGEAAANEAEPPDAARARRPASRTLYSNNNAAAVRNGPVRATTFTLDAPHVLTKLTTYHWNQGRGAPAGAISLRSADGTVLGPWTAEPDNRLYWTVRPQIVLAPGSYTIVVSAPSTWAQNQQSGGAGMAVVEGYRHAPAAPPAAAPPAAAPAAAAPAAADRAPVAQPPARLPPPAVALPGLPSAPGGAPPAGAAPARPVPDADAFRHFTTALERLEHFEASKDIAHWRAGLEAAQAAVERAPQVADYWRVLGYAYSLGASELELASAQAEEAYEKAIALDPRNTGSRLLLANLLIGRKSYSRALDQVEAALGIRPELATSPVVADMTRMYLIDRQAARGIAFFSAFAARHPRAHAILLGQAVLLKETGRKAEALALAQRVAGAPQAPQADAEHARALVKDMQE